MFLKKFFSKKYNYVYFDNGKQELITKKLLEQDILEIDKNDFAQDLLDFLRLVTIVKTDCDSKVNLLSDLNKNILELIRSKIDFILVRLYSNKVEKNEYYLLINDFRIVYKNYLSIITNESWQSPDYGSSIQKQHGIYQNKIYAFYNDYQRYRINTNLIESIFNDRKKDINGAKKTTYILNSGMASLMTLVNSFANFAYSKKIGGNNLYFESFSILKYQQNIQFFEEENIDQILEHIEKNNPEYLFFDPVVNSYKMAIFDFHKLFNYYKKNISDKNISIIIDTSLCLDLFDLSLFFKDFFPENLSIYLYRSLQKMDQFGLDISQGGIITHYGNNESMIDSYRQMGTTPSEKSILNFEIMSHFLPETKLERHSRNTLILFDYLSNLKSNLIENVFHPSKNLATFKAYHQTPLLYFSLKNFFTLEDNNYFLQELLAISKENNFFINLGTSFGFNSTRIMLVSFNDSNEIYFRLAFGMETISEVYKLIDILNILFESFLEKITKIYKNQELYLFKAKNDKYLELLENIDKTSCIEEKDFFQLSYIINDLIKDISKFENFKATKNYYKEQKEYYIENTLSFISKEKIKIDNELKIRIVKYLSSLFN